MKKAILTATMVCGVFLMGCQQQAKRPLTGAGVKGWVNPNRAAAIQEFRMCAQRYPESSFAPLAIGKVVDFYVEAQDYAQAGTMLEQVFTDYPDADFLDSMFLKWTLVAYQSGDYAKARDKYGASDVDTFLKDAEAVRKAVPSK